MPTPKRDYGFIAIVGLVVINAVWLLLMPWVPAVASTTLNRFHLRSGSFVAWAIQFPVPSMYNFANRFQVSTMPPGSLARMVDPILIEPLDGSSPAIATEFRYINHFPTRVLTFADMRYRSLNGGNECWLTIDSTYRGQRLESVFHAKSNPDGGFDFIRLEGEATP